MSSPQQKKYAAFISYRHLMPDMAIARALAQMLEHNMIRPNRQVKRNIREVFVDVNELPLTESLDGSITHALENSEILIVICSPNLPKSKYCMREISYFKELHGGRMDRIYTLLVDGEPDEAFPEILRTELRPYVDENGQEQTLAVPVEPLFADVRAATVKESIRKLRKTEYLRLAAAYYRCTYDDLYQRRRRWLGKLILGVGSIAAATALGFYAYAYTRNLQYSAVKATTYASYARERNEQGDELLAITLCEEAWEEGVFSRAQGYMTTLRSAVAQHDYKLRAAPFAPVMTADYIPSSSINPYLSSDDAVSVIMADSISQLTDTKTGLVLHNRPVDLFKIQESDVSWYLTISAQKDEQGVFQDTLSIWSMEDQRLINSFAFRPSQLTEPQYQLRILKATTVPHVLEITDHGQLLFRMDKQGSLITEEEFQRILAIGSQEEAPAPAAYTVGPVSSGFGKSKKVSYVIRNAAGETLLTLPFMPEYHALSPDQSHFACLAEGQFLVYDIASQALLSTVESERFTGVSHFLLLEDSTYAILSWSQGSNIDNLLLDWKTGEALGSFPGKALVGADHTFYAAQDGTLSGYHYNPLDLAGSADILAQQGDLFLTRSGSNIALRRGDGSILLQMESAKHYLNIDDATDGRVQCSDDLTRILIRGKEGLVCVDQTGKTLWQNSIQTRCFAMARDGSRAAFADEDGNVCVVSADDGSTLFAISAAELQDAATPDHLAVGKDGLFVSDRDANVVGRSLWFPAGSSTPVDLGHYTSATLFPEGMLILEADSYVQDFALWDVKSRTFLLHPEENTGKWAYSPRSGYLVRHLETSGNHRSLEIEVLRVKNGRVIPCARIPLPDAALTALRLDSTGKVLSLTAGDTTRIYRLEDLSPLLEANACPLYYESGAFFCREMIGGKLYTLPCLEGDDLHAFALDLITSGAGQRELSLTERGRYAFDE